MTYISGTPWACSIIIIAIRGEGGVRAGLAFQRWHCSIGYLIHEREIAWARARHPGRLEMQRRRINRICGAAVGWLAFSQVGLSM